MNKFTKRTLGDLCHFQAGNAFPPSAQGCVAGKYPFIKVSDLNLSGNEIFIFKSNNWVENKENYNIHKNGSIVFAKIGIALTYNRRRILTRDTIIDNNMMSATASHDVNGRFLYYLLCTIDFNDISSGSALPYLTVRDLNALTVFVPPQNEQYAIASILSSLDDKIELNRRTNETLEAMARALFRNWFVDFGPTRAKMAGEAPYLAPELWELFPDRLDDEEKPEGWKITRIGDCIERLKVGTLYSQKELELSGTVPVLDQGKNGIIGYHNNEPNIVATPNERVCTFANHTCTQKLIDFPFSTIQNVIPFKGKNFPSEWIFFATLGKQNFQEYKGHWPDFVEQTICTPDKSDVVNFYRKIIDPILNKQSENTREIETLTQLRDLLLPKLMSGEISIRDAEKMVEDVA